MQEIEEIGAWIKILGILLDLDKFKENLKYKTSYSKFDKYIKSYEFSLLFCLDRIFNILIYFPEIFDLSPDLLISRANQNQVHRGKFSRKSKLGILLSNVHGLCDEIIKSGNEIELKKQLLKLNENLVRPINLILSQNFEILEGYRKHSKDELLKKISRFYFYLYFNDVDKIKISFNDTFLKGKYFFPLPEIKIPVKLNEQFFFEGYKEIVDYIWQNILGDQYGRYGFFPKILKSKTWEEFDSYFEVIRDNLIHPLKTDGEIIEPLFKKVFSKKDKISNKTFIRLTQEELYPKPKKFRLNLKERLDEIFYWYPVRIIGSGLSLPNSRGFILILLGLIKYGSNEIKILKIKHKYPYEHIYSFAILIEAHSNIADYSQWYLFLEFCSEGTGIEAEAYDEIMRYIHKYKAKIDLKEHELSPKNLDRYAKDNLAKESTKKIRNLEIHKSSSKGIIYELFICYLFNSLGYKTKWRLKKDFTNNKEIDLLAYKDHRGYFEFNIIEISTKNEDISSEISTKINILKNNQSALLGYLKLNKNVECKFYGKLITMKKSKIRQTELIEILDESDLKELSEKVDINFDVIKKLLVDEKKKLSTDELIRYSDMDFYLNK